MRDRMGEAEYLYGSGIVMTDQGKRIRVEYDLYVTEAEQRSSIALKRVEGLVYSRHEPSFASVYFGQSMTLELEDGRRLRFHHRDIDGNIALNEWIG